MRHITVICDGCGAEETHDFCRACEKSAVSKPAPQHIHEPCGHVLSVGTDFIACAICNMQWKLVKEPARAHSSD